MKSLMRTRNWSERRFTMAHPMQHRKWTGGVDLRMTVASMAVAILLIVMAWQPIEAQTFATLHGFSGPDGATPTAGLTMGAARGPYGGTQNGGTARSAERRG